MNFLKLFASLYELVVKLTWDKEFKANLSLQPKPEHHAHGHHGKKEDS